MGFLSNEDRAIALMGQDVFDVQTQFLRDHSRLTSFVAMRAAVSTGAPQWQIEGLPRLEIPADMQRQRGPVPLGPASTRHLRQQRLWYLQLRPSRPTRHPDRFVSIKVDYLRNGANAGNLRHGYIRRT